MLAYRQIATDRGADGTSLPVDRKVENQNEWSWDPLPSPPHPHPLEFKFLPSVLPLSLAPYFPHVEPIGGMIASF